MAYYWNVEHYEWLCQQPNAHSASVIFYQDFSAQINAERDVRERDRMIAAGWVEVSLIDPCAPIESVIDAEMRAMHEWKKRAEAKAQHMPCVQPGPQPDRRAPFPAAALAGCVMRVGAADTILRYQWSGNYGGCAPYMVALAQ